MGTSTRKPSRQDVEGLTPNAYEVMLVYLADMHRTPAPTGHADRSTGRQALRLSVTNRVTRTAAEDPYIINVTCLYISFDDI